MLRPAWRRIDSVRRGVRLRWLCGRRDGCSSGPSTISNSVLIAAKRSIMSGGGGVSPKTANYVVPVDEIRQFVCDCMTSVGTNASHAAQLADLLIAADERGHYSHGMNRLHIYMEDVASKNCDGNGQPKVLRRKGATAWVDGGNALGVVVGNFCTDLAVELAREVGVGWVVARESNHYGIAGYYSLRMSREHGLVGACFTNTSPLVYPCRGAELGLGTNPLSVVAPSADVDDAFELDMATSTAALGKIEIAERNGRTIPATWAADARGNSTTDPADVTQKGGALLSLGGMEATGGYKGSGLGMMVEVFCGILAGSNYGKNIRSWREVSRQAHLGQCFVAIDPSCFAPGFGDRMKSFLDETRGLKPADPTKPVLVPGDPERANVERSRRAGGLIYTEAQVRHLEDIGKKAQIKLFSSKLLNN